MIPIIAIPKSVDISLVGNLETERAGKSTKYALQLQYRLTMECEYFGYRFRNRHQFGRLGLITLSYGHAWVYVRRSLRSITPIYHRFTVFLGKLKSARL